MPYQSAILTCVLSISMATTSIYCQDLSWTWLGGSPTGNEQMTKDHPGARSGATYWQQSDNVTLWVFGGEYHVEHAQPGLRNDLWMYSLGKRTWTLAHNGTYGINGVPSARQLAAGCGVIGSYFVLFGGLGENEDPLGDTWLFYIPEKQWYTLEKLRVKLGANNDTGAAMPGSRGDMAAWCNSGKDMVVFGGFDKKANLHNDMWKFSLQALTWKQTEKSALIPADNDFVSHLPYPGGRSGATTWTVKDALYMYGGNILPKNLRSKHLMIGNTGDMWKYDITSDTWFYLRGTRKVCTTPGKYGELGTENWSYEPGCRRRAASWIDSNFNLWMFGGDGIDNSQESLSVFKHSQLLSDIWFFNTRTHKWTWKGGAETGGAKGLFGEKGKSSKTDHPGARCEMVAYKLYNDLHLIGGVGHDVKGHDWYLNDIWKLDVHLDSSVMKNNPYAGPVFTIIFLAVGLVVFVSIIYLFSRKYYVNSQSHTGGKYTRVPVDIPE